MVNPRMTPRKLMLEQKRIDTLVINRARKHGLSSNSFDPIRDGIGDEKGYLQSRLKVAWVLKEPYDEWEKDGSPCGGGWSLVKDCFQKDDAWKNPVWQKIAYVMYGFHNNQRWEQMPRIRDYHQMIDELWHIAWINLSKMPSQTASSMSDVEWNYREHWEDIVKTQLSLCQPDVIIFGYTFGCMRADYPDAKPVRRYSNEIVSFLLRDNQVLLDTKHPGRKGGKYVNALIKALQVACRLLGK